MECSNETTYQIVLPSVVDTSSYPILVMGELKEQQRDTEGDRGEDDGVESESRGD